MHAFLCITSLCKLFVTSDGRVEAILSYSPCFYSFETQYRRHIMSVSPAIRRWALHER